MRMTIAGVVAAVMALAVPLSARQVPTAPPQSVYPDCLRTDVEKTTELLRKAMEKTPPEEVVEVQKKIAGCIYYQITLQSKVSVLDNEVPGVSSTIMGAGSITFGLAPDVSEPEYALTSGTRDLTAPIYWVQESALISRPNCEVATVVAPYTGFAFWLGVTSTPAPKVAVRIVPDDHDLHAIATRCKDPLGRWTPAIPGREAIFSPAWIKLHGHGEATTSPTASPQPPAMDLGNIAAMDPGKIQAMAEKMKANPTDMTDLMKLMKQVVPNADQLLEAARNNFMFKAPGRWCVTDPVLVARCTISDTVKFADRTGYGTLKTIIESTVITIEKVPPPAGAP